jgi:hypothetical protein
MAMGRKSYGSYDREECQFSEEFISSLSKIIFEK